jgi:hypothetical protein
MATYAEKLLDPRWQKKRLEVLERDKWSCRNCYDSKNTLHVHHLYYENNRDPWGYELSSLVTLCESCHKNEHTTSDWQVFGKCLLKTLAANGFCVADLIDLSRRIDYWCGPKQHLSPPQFIASVYSMDTTMAQRELAGGDAKEAGMP